jgi:glycosyltransferase involved in cell wall biosynthesis
MEFSVVVPTLNGRERLGRCLDSLAGRDAEVVVVNGPSTDGTSGTARGHEAVDSVLEVAERNLHIAWNAGIEIASGDAVAFLHDDTVPEGEWFRAAGEALADGAGAVTGPVHRSVGGGITTETEETTTLAGRTVTFFDGGNVALSRAALRDLDGFDEYLVVGGARDAAHRLAGMEYRVAWDSRVAVHREGDVDQAARFADLGHDDGPAWGRRYRSLSYRLVKNYGLGLRVAARVTRHAVVDGVRALAGVLRDGQSASSWVGDGRDVVTSTVGGGRDGLGARRADPTPRRNPNGVSARSDRVVTRLDE